MRCVQIVNTKITAFNNYSFTLFIKIVKTESFLASVKIPDNLKEN